MLALDNEQDVGIAITAVGGLRSNGGDRHRVQGPTTSTDQTSEQALLGSEQHPIDCGQAPAGAVHLGLVASANGSAQYVPLGVTDANGALAVSWRTLASRWPASAALDADVVTGEPDELAAKIQTGAKPASVAHITLPGSADPEKAWSDAAAADTVEALRAYHDRFPNSSHAEEASVRAKRLAVVAEQAAFDAAVARQQG